MSKKWWNDEHTCVRCDKPADLLAVTHIASRDGYDVVCGDCLTQQERAAIAAAPVYQPERATT